MQDKENSPSAESIEEACLLGILPELANEYLLSCCTQKKEGECEDIEEKERKTRKKDGDKGTAKFPNVAGFCRYFGIGKRRYDQLSKKYPEEFAFYKANLGLHQFVDGESYTTMLQRLLPMIDKIVADNKDKTVVIGTHGAVVRGLLSVWQGVPLERLLEIPRVPNGTITEVEIEGDSARVIKLGFGDYLSERTGVHGVD